MKITKLAGRLGPGLRRQMSYLRDQGFIKFYRHILTDFIHHHHYVVFAGDISRERQEIRPKIPADIRLLSTDESDISRLVEIWPSAYAPRFSTRPMIRQIIIERLSAGERCMIAEHAGKIVYMEWFGTGMVVPFSRKRGLKNGEVLGYNSYCCPEMRGNGLMTAVSYQILEYLQGQHFQRFIGYVPSKNVPSRKANERFCGRPRQTLHHWNILGMNFYFLSPFRRG